MAKLLGIDVGTSGAKVLLIDETGAVLKSASREYPLLVPRPLWAEQDPTLWRAAIVACIAEIGEDAPDAIGLTGQMHGAVFLDESGAVIRPAILWCDQRTVAECAEIDRRAGPDRVRAITANPPLTGFQAPKALWLRNHEPESFARVRQLLLPKDWLRFEMTGESVTEVSDASGTGLFDVAKRTWSAEMLAALDLPADWLPRVVESDEVTGVTRGFPGLRDGIPVVGGGDQAAGAVGTGAVVPGIVSVSLGTSGVVFTAIAAPSADPSGAAHVFAHANRSWHAMGVMLSCGGAVRWLRDTLYAGEGWEALNAEADAVAPGCDGLTFLPYLTGERTPHNDPLARGAWAGLTLGATRGHLSRAVFEGVCFGLRDGLDRLRALGAQASEVRLSGGGAQSELWRQTLADVLGVPCLRLAIDEGPAFGAAILAGVGIGVWPNTAVACEATVRTVGTTRPSGTDYTAGYARFRSLYPALKDWTHTLA